MSCSARRVTGIKPYPLPLRNIHYFFFPELHHARLYAVGLVFVKSNNNRLMCLRLVLSKVVIAKIICPLSWLEGHNTLYLLTYLKDFQGAYRGSRSVFLKTILHRAHVVATFFLPQRVMGSRFYGLSPFSGDIEPLCLSSICPLNTLSPSTVLKRKTMSLWCCVLVSPKTTLHLKNLDIFTVCFSCSTPDSTCHAAGCSGHMKSLFSSPSSTGPPLFPSREKNFANIWCWPSPCPLESQVKTDHVLRTFFI
jgi:hypothetical protein